MYVHVPIMSLAPGHIKGSDDNTARQLEQFFNLGFGESGLGEAAAEKAQICSGEKGRERKRGAGGWRLRSEVEHFYNLGFGESGLAEAAAKKAQVCSGVRGWVGVG